MKGFDVVVAAGMAEGRGQMAAVCSLPSAVCLPAVLGQNELVEYRHGY